MAVAAERVKYTSADEPRLEEMIAVWRELDPPVGFRAEISEGAIVMTPPPGGVHNAIAWIVQQRLAPLIAADLGLFHSVAIRIDAADRVCIPDLVAAPLHVVLGRDAMLAPAEAMLVMEITSRSNARVDRIEKRDAYALGGVPLYLLVDRVGEHPAATLHAEPADGEYRRVTAAPFGETLHLPVPFDADLDTAQFPR